MFFTQINQMMNQGVDITLVIRKREGLMTVSAVPKANGLKDEAQNHIIPLTLTGTPEELDGAFLQTICQPMQKTSGLLANMRQFEKQADKAAANSKAAKELKEKELKEAKEKRERFEKLMKSAGELETGQKYSEAISTLQYAKTFASDQSIKSVDEKIAALKGKVSQGSLFDMESNRQPQQVPQAPPTQPPVVNQPQVTSQPEVAGLQPVQTTLQQPTQQQPQEQVPTQTTIVSEAPVQLPEHQQPVQQQLQEQSIQNPVQENVVHPSILQQTAQHPTQGLSNGSYPPQNGQQVYGQNMGNSNVPPNSNEATNGNVTVTNQGHPVNESLQMIDYNPAHAHSMPVDYSAHREGEYDQYPDFPPQSNNPLYNH